MPPVVRELDAAAMPAWDRFVADCPDATFFHRAGWRTAIENTYGHHAHFLYAEQDGAIAGVLPLVHIRSRLFANGLISLPFCVGGGPVALSPEIHAALDRAALDLLGRLGGSYIEYRDDDRERPGWVRRDGLYAGFARPLEADEEACMKQIPRRQRAVVRHTLTAGLVDEIDADPRRLYPLYALSVRNLGTPVFPRRWFDRLMQVFAGDCEVLTVTHQGRAVASELSFYFRGRVMPYYIGAGAEARHLGANDFLHWRLMRRAAQRGCTIFDFGRSKLGTGPYAFKSNWGFEPRPVAHAYALRPGLAVPEINPVNPKYKMFIALWKRLPLPVANLLGPHIVRNIG